MTAIGYARVSTPGQAEKGMSLSVQEEKIRAMAVVQGAELLDVIVDGGESAKDLKRPGVERLLALVDARKVDAVIIAKLDRLTRSVRDIGVILERLERAGVALVSVHESLDTGSASGRLVVNIMTAVSQWEREAIGERTREVLGAKRARGEKLGGHVPYGCRAASKKLVPYEPEVAVVRAARDLSDLGYSTRDIAERLNERGLRTRAGTLWRFQYVARILKGVQVGA